MIRLGQGLRRCAPAERFQTAVEFRAALKALPEQDY